MRVETFVEKLSDDTPTGARLILETYEPGIDHDGSGVPFVGLWTRGPDQIEDTMVLAENDRMIYLNIHEARRLFAQLGRWLHSGPEGAHRNT